jgi:hypothetical protein
MAALNAQVKRVSQKEFATMEGVPRQMHTKGNPSLTRVEHPHRHWNPPVSSCRHLNKPFASYQA